MWRTARASAWTRHGQRPVPPGAGRAATQELQGGWAVGHRSFRWSFHLGPLDPTGAYLLDDPRDLSCQDSTRQHPVDGSPLSCKQQVGGSRPQGCRSRCWWRRWRCSRVRCVGGSAHPGISSLRLGRRRWPWRLGDGRGSARWSVHRSGDWRRRAARGARHLLGAAVSRAPPSPWGRRR
jgi:hypothetical protein